MNGLMLGVLVVSETIHVTIRPTIDFSNVISQLIDLREAINRLIYDLTEDNPSV